MALKTTVKINEINNLTDARYCAGMGVDMIGFVMDKSLPNYTESKDFHEIKNWIAGVKIVGEVAQYGKEELKAVLEIYTPDYVQTTSIDTYKMLKEMKVPTIIKVMVYEYEKLEYLKLRGNQPDYLLLENKVETISPMEEGQIRELSRTFNLLLSYAINKDNVEQILKTYDLAGIGLYGGDEVRPGYKEFDDLADILEKLEVE